MPSHPGAGWVSVTPSHKFPTGVTMSMSRRLELLELAEDYDPLVIEDDYDTEFRYVDRPLEPIYRLDRKGRSPMSPASPRRCHMTTYKL